MRNLLLATCFVLLTVGCADLAGTMESTHTLMTQTPPPDSSERASRKRVRHVSEADRGRYAETSQATPAVVYQQQQQPLSRSERAMNVLRRSRATSWMFGGPRVLGPASPGSGSTSTATSRSVSPTAQTIPSVRPSTPQAAPTSQPGEGRVIVGQPRDTGSGIKSTVTGTPVEPIPGTTPPPVDAEEDDEPN